MTNIILDTDSYKFSHYLQYPPGTRYVSSYIEARGVESSRDWEEVVFFGLQPFLEYLEANTVLFSHIDEAGEIAKAHGVPFNRQGWSDIQKYYGGRLPVSIQALPEGTVVPIGTPLVQVVNTASDMPWLTSYLETALLRAVWYPTTVATQSYYIRKVLREMLIKTGSDLGALPFMLNDFGSRGASSKETAAIGGAAHLVTFQGTDNLAAIELCRDVYGEDMAGFSVIAAEHSTITSWGRDREADAYENMLSLATPNSIVAVVSDSYDIYNACRFIWGHKLKDKVNALAEIGARLVIRPDSGEPDVVPIQCVEILIEKFGYTMTSTGHKLLPAHIRVLQGDGINEKSIRQILEVAAARNLAAENFVFGMGGAMLQSVNRDTLKFAMKANEITTAGGTYDVYKDPVHGGKSSKRGRQAVVNKRAYRESELIPANVNMLKEVFRNGFVLNRESLIQIRKRVP